MIIYLTQEDLKCYQTQREADMIKMLEQEEQEEEKETESEGKQENVKSCLCISLEEARNKKEIKK